MVHADEPRGSGTEKGTSEATPIVPRRPGQATTQLAARIAATLATTGVAPFPGP